jgi:hypothetical protein
MIQDMKKQYTLCIQEELIYFMIHSYRKAQHSVSLNENVSPFVASSLLAAKIWINSY